IVRHLPLYLQPVFAQRSHAHRALHPFPTRRSSDLDGYASPFRAKLQVSLGKTEERLIVPFPRGSRRLLAETSANELVPPFRPKRSEEHTSELQSRFDLVCRLLLEKKNSIAQESPRP